MEGKHKTLEECEKKCKALPKSLGGLLGYSGYNVEAMYRPILRHMEGRRSAASRLRETSVARRAARHLELADDTWVFPDFTRVLALRT